MVRKVIICEVMKEEITTIKPYGEVEFEFVPLGLHDIPNKLRVELQEIIDRSAGYDMIILAFGLCGNAAKDLVAKHCPLVIPRIHDCFPLFFGSDQSYKQFKGDNIGTYFLTTGWTEGERSVLAEYQRICREFGRHEADEVMKTMYAGYDRLVFINTPHPRNDKGKHYAHKAAELLNLEYQEVTGNTKYLAALVNGPWNPRISILSTKETLSG